ncbi:MAG: FtsX-like permease family protein [Caldibacillus sp.]
MGITKAYLKELARSISRSKTRFFSIMAIIAIGVGFYAGINATEPDMVLSADHFYKNTNLSDFRIISPLGFEEEDIRNVEKLPGIRHVQAGYFTDLFVTFDENSHIGRIYSYDPGRNNKADELNRLRVIEGRLPEKSGEMVIDMDVDIPIGTEVTVSAPKDAELSDYLKRDTFTIVGKVHSPLYINYERGQTNIGDGSIDFYAYILDDDFAMERFTELYLQTDRSKEHLAYTTAYKNHIESIAAKIEMLGKETMAEKTAEIREEILERKRELAENKTTLENELKNAERELHNRERQLADAERELEKNEIKYRSEIANARKELEDGKRQLEEGKALYEENYQKWLDGKKQYEKGLAQLEESKKQLVLAEQQLKEGRRQLNELKGGLRTIQEIERFQTAVNNLDETATEEDYLQLIVAHPLLPESLVEELEKFVLIGFQENRSIINFMLTEALNQSLGEIFRHPEFSSIPPEQQNIAMLEHLVETTEQELNTAQKNYESGLQQFEEGQKELEKARIELEQGEKELEQAKKQLEDSERELKSGEKKLNDEERKLEQSLREAREEIVKGKNELEEGWEEFRKEKEKAEKEIQKAEEDLQQAERDLEEIPDEWIVQTREGNPGYSGYGDDAERIGAIAKVFPLFFFLVAALVALTTMTRMVDEERVQIGTLKALGYGTITIASKYLIYALISSLTGAIIGLVVGYKLFPFVIMNAYGMMYDIPVKLMPFHWNYAIISVILAIVTTTVATLFAIIHELQAEPAILMQPKAPKPGKRIFLERIKPFWSRLSFSQKVSFRNVFRYKRRFFMTVLGIAGCTGLLLTGFGIRDSVNDIMGKQFSEIFLYDGQIIIDDDKLTLEDVHDLLATNSDIQDYLPVQMEKIDVEANGRTYEANLMVPLDIETFTKMIDLHERTTGKPVPLEADGVVITEKLAKLLDVGLGDTFSFINPEHIRYEVKVGGIAENYLMHYIYMPPEYYEEIANTDAVVNSAMFTIKDQENLSAQQFKEELLEHDGVLSIVFLSDIEEEFNDMMGNLNFVIIVIILSAGALAFLVLFNLTNINITERIREIATIKVLGFRDHEVDAYIFRENMLLTLVGTFLGLFLGILFHKYIIRTMEIDSMMFGQQAHPESFLWSILLTLIFTLLVNLFMHRKLKRVNMVESLKSVE